VKNKKSLLDLKTEIENNKKMFKFLFVLGFVAVAIIAVDDLLTYSRVTDKTLIILIFHVTLILAQLFVIHTLESELKFRQLEEKVNLRESSNFVEKNGVIRFIRGVNEK